MHSHPEIKSSEAPIDSLMVRVDRKKAGAGILAPAPAIDAYGIVEIICLLLTSWEEYQ